jgi:hypothetical protein
MRLSLVGALAPLVIVTACGQVATQPDDSGVAAQLVELGDTVRLEPGATARVRGTEILVTFRRVEADSRCPIDALCVWPGDAQVRLEFTGGGSVGTPADLHTFVEPREVEFKGYRFRVIELVPAPVSTQTTLPGDYRVALEVTSR